VVNATASSWPLSSDYLAVLLSRYVHGRKGAFESVLHHMPSSLHRCSLTRHCSLHLSDGLGAQMKSGHGCRQMASL
jgi:hypothetical protein